MSTESAARCLSVLGQDVFALTQACCLVGGVLISLMFSLPSHWLFKQEVRTSSTGLLLAFCRPSRTLRPGLRMKRLSPLSLGEGHIPIILKHLPP